MGRFATTELINADFAPERYVKGAPIGDLTANPFLKASDGTKALRACEIAFWFRRVRTVRVFGSVVPGSGIPVIPFDFVCDPYDPNSVLIGSEEAMWHDFLSFHGTDPSHSPGTGTTISFGTESTVRLGDNEWYPHLIVSGLVGSSFSVTPIPPGLVVDDFIIARIQGDDLVVNESYSRRVNMYVTAPVDPAQIEEITIEPSSFWSYAGKYDTGTGALTGN